MFSFIIITDILCLLYCSVLAFLPRSKGLLISWLQSPFTVILESKKIKPVTVSIVSPSNSMKWWDWMFKPAFSLSSFTFIRRLFSFSLLSAIKVMSSTYLTLSIFLLAILIPACASSTPAFHMYFAYKLNKRGDNAQAWRTDLILNQFAAPCLVLTAVSWPVYRFPRSGNEAGQVVWYSHLLKNFPVCCDPHNQRLYRSQWSRRCFSGIHLLFL